MKQKGIMSIFVLTLITSTVLVSAGQIWKADSVDPSLNVGSDSNICQIPVQNVTFRLLAVEGFSSRDPEFPIQNDTAMKSAQYLIEKLLKFNNWNNGSSPPNFNYTSYIHLLSYANISTACLPYYKGVSNITNVVSEIQNFLGQTFPAENSSLSIRIFYYIGHGGLKWNSTQGRMSYYLALGINGSDPTLPSPYQELYDWRLDQLLNWTPNLRNSNCTLVILDSCHSGQSLKALNRRGRVILTSCNPIEFSWGWSDNSTAIAPGYWGWFSGHQNACYRSGINFGPLGLLGGISTATDTNGDGWRTAGEIFPFANITTTWYAANVSKSQHPQRCYGVLNGSIPLVQYNNFTAFPYNGQPIKLPAPPPPPPKPRPPWAMFHRTPLNPGFTDSPGPADPLSLWNKNLESPVQSSPAIVDGMAFVGTLGGGGTPMGLYALNLATGDVVWNFATPSGICSSPAVVDGMVFFGTLGGGGTPCILYALDECTGLIRWRHEFPNGTEIRSSPAVVDSMVFISTMGGGGAPIGVHAFNETTGEPIWYYLTGNQVLSSPAVADGMVFVGSYDGNVYALDQHTGERIWNYTTGGIVWSSPAVADGMVFVGSMDRKVYAINETTGIPIWTYTTGHWVISSPAVDSSRSLVIVGCLDGYVYAIHEMIGSREWNCSTGPITLSSPAISGNGLVYIGSMNNKTYCINENTGEEVWSYETGGQIVSSPAITDDHVLIGSNDGNVYCFGPPFPLHNVAVTDVTAPPTAVSPGDPVHITYTAKNKGNVAETFKITIAYNTTQVWTPPFYYETTPIHTETTTLQPGTNITKAYVWNTTDIPPGKYTISVQARDGPYETDMSDNIYMDGWVVVATPGDFDCDGDIDIDDIRYFCAAYIDFWSVPSIKDPLCDFDGDCDIDIDDIRTFCTAYIEYWS